MNYKLKRNTAIIIPIVVAVLAAIGMLLLSGSFLIHPSFDIQYEKLGEHIESITVTNNGWIQAKNIKIYVSPRPTSLQFSDCPEYSEPGKDPSLPLILERMSQNVPCTLETVRVENQTEKITVTADDSPASVWKQGTDN
jgi:hypothetical protein